MLLRHDGLELRVEVLLELRDCRRVHPAFNSANGEEVDQSCFRVLPRGLDLLLPLHGVFESLDEVEVVVDAGAHVVQEVLGLGGKDDRLGLGGVLGGSLGIRGHVVPSLWSLNMACRAM